MNDVDLGGASDVAGLPVDGGPGTALVDVKNSRALIAGLPGNDLPAGAQDVGRGGAGGAVGLTPSGRTPKLSKANRRRPPVRLPSDG